MDLYCSRCGEPWDHGCIEEEAVARYAVPYYIDSLGQPSDSRKGELNPAYSGEDYAAVYQQVSAEFRSRGCAAFREMRGTDEPCEKKESMRSLGAGVVYDLLGDDMDGAASMLDDFEYLGMLEEPDE